MGRLGGQPPRSARPLHEAISEQVRTAPSLARRVSMTIGVASVNGRTESLAVSTLITGTLACCRVMD